MNFALVTTQHFERRARKFLRKHPDLRSTLRDTLDLKMAVNRHGAEIENEVAIRA